MKTLLLPSVFSFLLTLGSVTASAQTFDAQASLPSFTSTENWVDASKTCFGSNTSANWLGDLLADESSLWVDEAHHSLVIVTQLDAKSFDSQAEEARTGLFSAAGTSWSLLGDRAIPGTDLREVTYRLTLAGRQYPATLLLVPSEAGGTVVVSLAATPEVSHSQGAALASAFSRGGDLQSMMAVSHR